LAERDLPEDSTTGEDEDRDDERGDVEDEKTGDAEPTPTSWALRGALVGAIAGSVVGAGLGMFFAWRPEALTQARTAIGGRGTHVARAAAVAAGEAMTSRHVNRLLKAESNDDRGELMKQAAREAGIAAATAARDEIISLRGSSRGVVEGGGNGARA
jgi:hypothetical protein